MKASLINLVESQVSRFRNSVGLSDTEAVSIKSLLLKLNVLTLFRPLSDSFSGMSLRSGDKRFMLINSNHPRSYQHFTIAHELYHLFMEENPFPHKRETSEKKDATEQCADAFASRFLMPKEGLIQLIPEKELMDGRVSLGSLIRIEHYFAVSRSAALDRLQDLKLIDKTTMENMSAYPEIRTAREYGYDTMMYEPGNENLVIGDFGEKARNLFENDKISEGHYLELLHKIGIYGND